MCCQISCKDTRGDLQHETLVGVAHLRGHPFVDCYIFRKCAEPGGGGRGVPPQHHSWGLSCFHRLRFLEDGIVGIDVDGGRRLAQFHFFNGLLAGWFQNDAALAGGR